METTTADNAPDQETINRKMDLVARLLAKAEQTTPREAEALTEHAERLMVKHGIDQALIDEKRARRGQATEPIVTEAVLLSGT